MQSKVNFLKSKVMYVFMTLCVSVLCAVCMGSVAKAVESIGDKNEATIVVTKYWKGDKAPSVGTSFTFKVNDDEYTVTKGSSGLNITGTPDGITASGVISDPTPDGYKEVWVITLKGYPKYALNDGGGIQLIDYTITETNVESGEDGITWYFGNNGAPVSSGVRKSTTYQLQLIPAEGGAEALVTIERTSGEADAYGLAKATFAVTEINTNYVTYSGDLPTLSDSGHVEFGIAGGQDKFFLYYAVNADGDMALEFRDLPQVAYNGTDLDATTPYVVAKPQVE